MSSPPVSQSNTAPVVVLRSTFFNLAIKIFLVIVITWVSIYLFQTYLAPYIGIHHLQLQVIWSIAIVAVAFIITRSLNKMILNLVGKISPHLASTISFFAVIMISLLAIIAIMYQLQVDAQTILVGGGVTAVIIGIALSTIVGNILSGGLVLTTFPAKIGDSIFIVNDNIRGKIDEVNLLYTKVKTDQGSEYFVPNNAVVQGLVRLTKESNTIKDNNDLPFSEGDKIELANQMGRRFTGTVDKINPKFVSLIADTDENIIITISTDAILSGQFIIIIKRAIHKDHTAKTSEAQ
jgi:small conductance mechanosensitive channel